MDQATLNVGVAAVELRVGLFHQKRPDLSLVRLWVRAQSREGGRSTLSVDEELVVDGDHNRCLAAVKHDRVNALVAKDARLGVEDLSDELRSLVSNDAHRREQVAVTKRALPDIIGGNTVRENFCLALVRPLISRTNYVLHSDVVKLFLKLSLGLVELELVIVVNGLAGASD